MKITSEENIMQVLLALNPWWSTGTVGRGFVKPVKRFAYYEALKILEHKDIRRMVLLSGARRTGKTTILYQIIEHLLDKNTDITSILYVSFDHPLLKLCSIAEIMEIYTKNIYDGERVYLFFDEIQYADNWDTWLKTIYDLKPHVKAVATGSASPLLVCRGGESGVGRWTFLSVPTLSFYEYCDLMNVAEVTDISAKPSDLLHLARTEQTKIFTMLLPLYKHFLRYMRVGGFPELALSDDDIYAQRMLREDVVDKVLKRDIPSIYNIRSAAELEKIFLYLCYHSSNIVSVESIAKELGGLSRPTVERYIHYLESANLIYVSLPIGLGGKKILKARPKIYIADTAMRNAVIMHDGINAGAEEMGIIVETAVYKHIRAFYYQNSSTKVGYYRDATAGGREIDVVVEYSPKSNILIEVKYREDSSIAQSDAIVRMCGEAQSSLLITKKENDYGVLENSNGKIYKIPAYAFLYLLGCAEKHGYHTMGLI